MSKRFVRFKKESRLDLGIYLNDTENPTREQLQFGAILRIADATEAMAKSYTELINENTRLKSALKSLEYHYDHLKKSNASYRGQITKLKNKYEQK